MKDHSENTLRAAIKCLRDTVAPAVDPQDPQAVEQLRLTIDFLEFLRTRLYDVHSRHRYELGHQMGVARSLMDDAVLVSPETGADIATSLGRSLERAASTHVDPGAHTRDLQAVSEELWGIVRAIIREARSAPEDVRARVSASVIAGIEPLVELESAWYLPFGFEPDPGSVPELPELLATRADG